MKIEEQDLQHLQSLVQHLAPLRQEPPLIDLPKIESLLDTHDMLPNPSRNKPRMIGMTITSVLATATILYFALHTQPQHLSKRYPSSVNLPAQRVQSQTVPSMHPILTTETYSDKIPVVVRAATPDSLRHGKWYAGTGLQYVTLAEDELAKIGAFNGNADTVGYYDRREKDGQLEKYGMSTRWSGGMETTALPANMNAPHSFPILISTGDGTGCMFRYSDSSGNGFIRMEDNGWVRKYLEWLHMPGTVGYQPLTYTTKEVADDNGHSFDTLRIVIGKDLAPAMMPIMNPDLPQYSKAVLDDLKQLALYYAGTASKPSREWPSTLFIKQDTVTARDLIRQIDAELNSANMQRMRTAFARINSLVPILIKKGKKDGLNAEDYIFWYEPTQEFLSYLPARWRKTFHHIPSTPAVGSSKSTIFTDVEISPNPPSANVKIQVSLSKPRVVQIIVRNLLGRQVLAATNLTVEQSAERTLDLSSLAPGIYLVQLTTDKNEQVLQRLVISR